MFKRILLAADGSPHSLRAAEKAIELARCSRNSKIDVLYVVDGSTSKADVLHSWNSLEIEKKRNEKMNSIVGIAKKYNIPYEIKIIRGEPGPSIVTYANKHDYDVVVIGSRGLNRMQEMVLGSVSHKVAKRVRCPVLIVK